MKGRIESIEYRTAIDFLLPRHYSGRKPNITKAFGWFLEDELVAVCTFGMPASPSLCTGVCWAEYKSRVRELNRLCAIEGIDFPLSAFVAGCLRRMRENLIIVSYADTAMGHVGKIYQACNFIYTGETKRRTDKYTPGGKHSRHYDKGATEVYRKVRSAKHRYVYFACSPNKRMNMRKEFLENLKYPVLPYPEGTSQRYKLGDYIQDEIIEVNKEK